MCSGHLLVASYSGPNFFLPRFDALMSLVLTFLFEYTNWSLGSDFTYNSITKKRFLNSTRKHMVALDGHKSHMTLSTIIKARQYDIDFIILPSYTSYE